jgi:uncharacterized protein involved in type VI secretion and phage assembly
MKRIQAQLPEDTARRLRALSAQEGVSVAELLRRGAELVLRVGPQDSPEERRRRARGVVARFSDAPEIAREHDEHLDEAFGA